MALPQENSEAKKVEEILRSIFPGTDIHRHTNTHLPTDSKCLMFRAGGEHISTSEGRLLRSRLLSQMKGRGDEEICQINMSPVNPNVRYLEYRVVIMVNNPRDFLCRIKPLLHPDLLKKIDLKDYHPTHLIGAPLTSARIPSRCNNKFFNFFRSFCPRPMLDDQDRAATPAPR